MSTFHIRCPVCGSEYSLDESHAGRKVKCAKCEGKFFIERNGQQIMARLAETPAAGHSPLTAETQVAAEWKVGDVILDLYEVKQIHEGGGMGLVYRVHHRGWNMDLAVKSPRLGYFQTEAQKENFSRECETWINLGLHPHIVSCYYVRTLGGIPRVFAEYVEGGSLKDWIDSRRLYEGGPQAALERILDVAIQIAWGLHHAHEQGLIHQDVKPANVLVAPDGTAKVSDFGLAKARVAGGESFVAGSGQSILVSTGGLTPAYCSPEQAARQPLTRRTDIWSWAVSVLEMFVGEVCWQSGVAAPEVLGCLGHLRLKAAGIPKPPGELLSMLDQCFAGNPSQRPGDVRVVADRLRDIFRSLTGQDYVRELPEAAKLHADALNNRAVSLLDLGRVEEAEKLFDEALVLEPGHPQSVYNRGLHLWRNGRMTDDVLVTAVEQSHRNRPADWNVPYLLGWIHLERREPDGAVRAFSEAEKLGGGREVERAIAEAQQRRNRGVKCLRTFEGHTGWVYSVALSTDGRWALSGSEDKTARLWDIGSGQCLRVFEGHTGEVKSVALSGDGRIALSGDFGTVRLWDVSSGRCLRTFLAEDQVNSVALSADWRWMLSCGGDLDETLRLWDLSSGQCLRILEGHTGEVESVALSEDGNWALSGGGLLDESLRFWDVSSGRCLRILEGHTDWVNSVALSADGRKGLSGSSDGTLRLWEMCSGRCIRVLHGHTGSVMAVALSADGRFALSGSPDKTVRLWELSSGRCLRTLAGHMHSVRSVALSRDTRCALSGETDYDSRTFRAWDLTALVDGSQTGKAQMAVCRMAGSKETLALQNRFRTLLSEARMDLSRNKFGRAWATISKAKSLKGYRFSADVLRIARCIGLRGMRKGLRDGWCVRIFDGHEGSVNSVALSADGRWILSGSEDETVRLWDPSSGQCIRAFQGHTGPVKSVAMGRDGRWALSGTAEDHCQRGRSDNSLRMWEVSSGRCLWTIAGEVASVALSGESRWALSGYWGFRLFEASSGRCLRNFNGLVRSVAFSEDGRWVLSDAADKTLRLWDVSSGLCIQIFQRYTGLLYSVALSADGRWALSGSGGLKSGNKNLQLWDVNRGCCVRTFPEQTAGVTSVALSANGRWALSGDYDKTVRLWDVSSGRCLRIFEGHTGSVNSVALSADGRWALSGSADRTLRLWELEWDCEFPEPRDWDDGARPCLETFLTLHCRLGEDGLTRVGNPAWTEEDFQELVIDLQYHDYGWLRPEGVRRQLEKMTAEWQGPPRLPGMD